MTTTTARTRECINRSMSCREFLFKIGPKDYEKRWTVTIDVARLLERDKIWSSNMHRDDPHRNCECQYCNRWRDEQ